MKENKYIVELDCYFFSDKTSPEEVENEVVEFFKTLQLKLGEEKVKSLEPKRIYKGWGKLIR